MSWRPLAIAALALVLLACDIEAQEQSEPLAVEVDGPTTTTTTTGRPEPPSTDRAPEVEFVATVFLIDEDDQLVPATRILTAPDDTAGRIGATIEALVDGLTDAEAAEGRRSAIPATTAVREVVVRAGTVRVDVSEDFAAIGGRSEVLAVGQLVLSATTLPEIERFTLHIGGEAVSLPLPSGALIDEPVTQEQFLELLGSG